MTTVVVTGASGRIGRRLLPTLVQAESVDRVVGLDVRGQSVKGVESLGCDLVRDELKPLLEGADTVVHLASVFRPDRDGLDSSQVDLAATHRLLEAAGAVGVTKLVLVSSAMVYGAWPDNPVPLTEAAPLRPNPDFAFAVHKTEVERTAAAWRAEHPGTKIVVLRPAVAIASDATSWVARTLRASAAISVGDEDPPVQFLHLDDLTSAVELATLHDLDGAYNVAPDAWVGRDEVRELDGRTPRVRLSEDAAGRITAFRWRHRLAPTPPGILPYTRYPWVVANDRLRAEGWAPEHSNEEAYVDAYRPRPWAMMNSRRHQQLALAGAATLVAGAATGATALARALRRR